MHPAGPPPAKHIHVAAPPDRLSLHGQDHALMDIEGPTVIAGQPRLIGRIRDKDRVQPGSGHRCAGFRNTSIIFVLAEWQIFLRHDENLRY